MQTFTILFTLFLRHVSKRHGEGDPQVYNLYVTLSGKILPQRTCSCFLAQRKDREFQTSATSSLEERLRGWNVLKGGGAQSISG